MKPAGQAGKKTGRKRTAAPDTLPLDETLEALIKAGLSPPEAAAWLNAELEHDRTRLLADGVAMHHNAIPTMLRIKVRYASDRRAYFEVEPQQALAMKPAERWAIERVSFEERRSKLTASRGGRPRRPGFHERVLIEALVIVGTRGVPSALASQKGGGLAEMVRTALKMSPNSSTRMIEEILRDPFNRIKKAERERR